LYFCPMGFLFISGGELTVVLLVALFVLGPKRIPEVARGLAKAIKTVRNASNEIKREIADVAERQMEDSDLKNTIQETKEAIDQAVDSVKRQ
jgi:sec-independent protein translocase protein TatA